MHDGLDRLTVVEAAERLGVKEQAVRKRIARGTLRHTKDEGGRVYVCTWSRPAPTLTRKRRVTVRGMARMLVP
jgi:excisionase family DNA binding protein